MKGDDNNKKETTFLSMRIGYNLENLSKNLSISYCSATLININVLVSFAVFLFTFTSSNGFELVDSILTSRLSWHEIATM